MSNITFNYLFAELTKHIAEDMIRTNRNPTIDVDDEPPCLAKARSVNDQQDGGKRLTDASFVDDLTVYAKPRAMTPASVGGTAERTFEIVFRWTYAYGTRPRAKKTKITMVLNGDNP